jgi:hypothetical protein
MHPSDKDCKRESDWVSNMDGTTFMLKYMIYAREQMFEMYGIAKHAESMNNEAGHKTSWQAKLCDNARLLPAAKQQRQASPNHIFVHGVALPPAAAASEPSRKSAAASGVPTWTPSGAAKSIQDKVEGSAQLAVVE